MKFWKRLKEGNPQWELNRFYRERLDTFNHEIGILHNRVSKLEREIDSLTTKDFDEGHSPMPARWNVRALAMMLHQVLEVLGYDVSPPGSGGWRIHPKNKKLKK